MPLYNRSEKTKRVLVWAFLLMFGTLLILVGYWKIAIGYWVFIAGLFIGDFFKKKKGRI